ncbi:uncharacterized protein RCO7_02212 [Rhynchosporium graminicola]|uniref:Dnase1 protein n=1 Tax=Rhynchosporium graminicola TaxID=2792576 RepID=A0A1E1LH64_9HELO|nr:uncharacterized protein RCO7_02212 [Rhynchosporium commune]
MKFASLSVLAGATLLPGVLAHPAARQATEFVNHCGRPIVFHQAFPAPLGSNAGYNGETMTLPAHGGSKTLPMIVKPPGQSGGVSTKFRWEGDHHLNGEFQFEYTLVAVADAAHQAGLTWDPSLVDAGGPGKGGRGPFGHVNVKITPSQTENPSRYWNCVPVTCKANQECVHAYKYYDNHNTRDHGRILCESIIFKLRMEVSSI